MTDRRKVGKYLLLNLANCRTIQAAQIKILPDNNRLWPRQFAQIVRLRAMRQCECQAFSIVIVLECQAGERFRMLVG